jgi:hypothetical protein
MTSHPTETEGGVSLQSEVDNIANSCNPVDDVLQRRHDGREMYRAVGNTDSDFSIT